MKVIDLSHAISVDPSDTKDFPIHKALFADDVIIIENLVSLESIGTHSFEFSCFPLRIQEADGSPVRAVAYLEQKKHNKPTRM